MLRSLVLLATLLLAGRAWALPCTGAPTELGITIAVEPADPALVDRIERLLRAALAARELSLCDADGPAGALAITLDVSARARLVVRDALTRKQLERTLELAALPADGRALAIAAAADELLRASYAELLLPDAPPPSDAPRLLEVATTTLPRRSSFELALEAGARLASARHAGVLALRLGSWFRPRWAAHALLRGELGDARDGAHGSVRANAVALELNVSHALVPIERRAGVALELGTGLTLLWFRAEANPSGLASSFTRGVWRVDGRVRAWWGPARLRALLSAGVSWAARPARALDEQRVVTAEQRVAGELMMGAASLF